MHANPAAAAAAAATAAAASQTPLGNTFLSAPSCSYFSNICHETFSGCFMVQVFPIEIKLLSGYQFFQLCGADCSLLLLMY
jgi:hypothetical protein